MIDHERECRAESPQASIHGESSTGALSENIVRNQVMNSFIIGIRLKTEWITAQASRLADLLKACRAYHRQQTPPMEYPDFWSTP